MVAMKQSEQPRPHMAEQVTFKAGETILREGMSGDSAFVISTGRVGIFKAIDGKRIQLATLEDGELLGELALLDGERRMATAVALTPVAALRIPKPVFEQKMRSVDPFIRSVMRVMATNLRNADKIYLKRQRPPRDTARLLALHTQALVDSVGTIEEAYMAEKLAEALKELDRIVSQISDITEEL